MLISFSLENWRSFRDRVAFSMVAGRERQHIDRVPRINELKTKVLPIAAIYGGNASGKSNFVDALFFAKRMVIRGFLPGVSIPIEPFRFDADA
ncbi:MAG: AAA family ATPase, partial [Chitinispirillales bacterium]|nr:AAA family ATPase [Chitinispirillales bacterium]